MKLKKNAIAPKRHNKVGDSFFSDRITYKIFEEDKIKTSLDNLIKDINSQKVNGNFVEARLIYDMGKFKFLFRFDFPPIYIHDTNLSFKTIYIQEKNLTDIEKFISKYTFLENYEIDDNSSSLMLTCHVSRLKIFEKYGEEFLQSMLKIIYPNLIEEELNVDNNIMLWN